MHERGFVRAELVVLSTADGLCQGVDDASGFSFDLLAIFAAAFVVAGAGVTVAKHGNRAVSSRSGSADVLAALGVDVEAPKETVERCIAEIGIGFLFAPRLHPAFKAVAGIRRELATRTVFNLLGPLANPAGARYQVLGVYEPRWVPVLGGVLGIGYAHKTSSMILSVEARWTQGFSKY